MAAQLFADWLEGGPSGDTSTAVVELVTYAQIKADKTAVGVSISWQEVA
jgi:hypothetical protein